MLKRNCIAGYLLRGSVVARRLVVESLALSLAILSPLSGLAQQEVPISEDDFKKLDTFEGTRLQKADKIFATKEWRQASAEYESFILDFPKSPAMSPSCPEGPLEADTRRSRRKFYREQ